MKNKIIIVIGTRPEAIKLLPVYKVLKSNSSFDVQILSTGQHKEMLQQVFDFFEEQPSIELSIMRTNQSLSQITSLLFSELDVIFKAELPDCVIVQGDTTSAMVAGLVAFYNKIKVAHIEAGLRSFNKHAPFPEEVNRRIVSITADFHFAPTATAHQNLLNEGQQLSFVTGNTVIDALFWALKKVQRNGRLYEAKFESVLKKDNNVVITVHRRESFGESLGDIFRAIKIICKQHEEIQFIFPAHLNPNVRSVIQQELRNVNNLKVIDPLPYDEMIYLMSMALIIITDSGGIQEEAPSLNVPLVVVREVTERPEGIDAGCALHAGTKTDSIVDTFNRIYSNSELFDAMKKAPNPYGDGQSCERIVRKLMELL